MKCILLTPWISPHQLPLAEAIAKLIGGDNFLYIYLEPPPPNHVLWGWDKLGKENWCKLGGIDNKVLLDCDVLLSGVRDVLKFNERVRLGKKTYYMSERWFKPPIGMLRLLHPRYFLMAWRIVRLIRDSETFVYLPMGIHAARDMARLCGLFAGDLRCLFRAPKLDFERKPGGRIYLAASSLQLPAATATKSKRYCLDKMCMWGYYVEPSKVDALPVREASNEVRVLWVGRLLNLKRVDTIVRAVGEHANLKRVDNLLPKITLDIYGTGPEEKRLKSLAKKYGDATTFHGPVSVMEVRRLMRSHDVYVLASNGYEGWGAVVSEALEEKMTVFGTYEAGSSVTMLPERNLFHAGDWKRLMGLLRDSKKGERNLICESFDWSAEVAAKNLMKDFING